MNALNILIFLATLASDDFCSKRLDHLLALHREYGLPLPPPDAVLVTVGERGGQSLEFLVDGHTVWPDRQWKRIPVRCVTPDVERLRDVSSLDWLTMALASHERGWKPLARVALRKEMGSFTQYGIWPDLERFVGRNAVDYWEQQIYTSPETALPVIAKYLKRVQHYSLEKLKSRALLRSVELAMVPRNSKPGSDDALIDALLGLSGGAGDDGVPGGYRQDPRYRAVLGRGLDIVPALIAHLNDDRITRARGRGCGDYHRTVKGVILEILSDLRGGGYTLENEPLNEQLKIIGEWFSDAHKLGEEKYLISGVLGEDEEDSFFREPLFWVLTEKYPHNLPDVFRKLIDTRPSHSDESWHYTKAIAGAPIPLAEKRKIFEYAARQKDPAVRTAGTYYLSWLNPGRKAELLLELSELPNMNGFQIDLARTIAESADAAEWKALAIIVRRAKAASRLRLLEVISEGKAPEGQKHRLSLLTEYLADDDLFVNKNAYAPFARVEVRNFAAMQLAGLLGLETDFDDLTAAEWAELRARVKARVQEELRR